ncbi:MAG: DegV family protein [Cellvibrionaceae bacterium]
MSKACIAVDSACDLPSAFIASHGIRILPIKLKLGDKTFLDTRDQRRTVQLYASTRLEKHFAAESEPVSATEMSELMEKELALKYDVVLAITISSKRSDVYKNIREAAFVSTEKCKAIRERQGKTGPFKIKVIDSETLFPGQGLLVYEAIRLLEQKKMSLRDIINSLEAVKGGIRAYLVPDSLFHLKNRASAKGDNSVNWFSYQMGNMLDIKPIVEGHGGVTTPIDKVRGFTRGLKNLFDRAEAAMDKGLSINAVNMSYAGDLKQIERRPEYQDFLEIAKQKGVVTMLSVMSTTAAINVGPGAFALAFATRD